MGQIRLLDHHIANQIAAGEVVERPSSVVKELVENAVDAGASRIDVTIEEGGLRLIRVIDNGTGMDADDVQLAFSRHATSKIATGKDLFRIVTLGFRGEALPSIAAVSRLTCTSSVDDSGLGTELLIEGGAVVHCKDAAASRGTDIAVRDLFYNTPARLKYMKTVQTEMSHISDYMYRLALAHPGIAFTLRHNGNSLLQTSGNGDLLQVIAAVYGSSSAKQMTAVEADSPDYALTGYISKPELNRSNRQAVTFIINGRYVRSFPLAQAVQQAYHTLLPIHRYPLAVLHIGMEPSLIDVNVHPAKLEVRFSKEQELFKFVESSVRHALRQLVYIPKPENRPAAKIREHVVQERFSFAEPPASANAAPAHPAGSKPAERPVIRDRAPYGNPAMREPSYRNERPSGRAMPPAGAADWVRPPEQQAPALPKFPELQPIGQLHGTYIVAQNENGLYLLDQHAAHERIQYERYYDLFGQPADASQQLAVPITLEFTSAEASIIADRLPVFAQAGVIMEHFGGHSFIVRACPYWFPAGEEERIITEMADWILSEKQAIDLAKLREKSAMSAACKSSVRANEVLSISEMETLIKRLSACRNPFTCPHGRPITVSFTTHELEKMFKRVM